MTDTADHVEDRLADFTRDRRILLLSLMAIVVGVLSAITAKAQVWLIAVFTNLTFYQRFSSDFISPTEKIRGHGIPEALEAILFGRSRMSLKVAVLKPLSSAISIGSGGPFGAEGPIIMTGGALGSIFAQLFHLSARARSFR